MAQVISQQGNIFGRVGAGLGQGLGQGLSEQLPKEMDNKRLKSGLKTLAEKSGKLSPDEYLAEASGIYGITPQMIQSFGELAKNKRQGNAYDTAPSESKTSNNSVRNSSQTPNSQNEPVGNQRQLGSQDVNQRTSSVKSNDRTSEIVNENPLNPDERTRTPWSPEQRNSAVSDYIKLGFLPEKAEQLAADDESRDLATPGALQKRREELTEKRKEARAEFERQLQLKLQKTGDNVFKDLTGDMINNMQRGLERDLVENPRLSFQEAANDWTNRALELAKTKSQLEKAGKTTGFEAFLKGGATLQKLKSYQPIFEKAGNAEEYSKLLETNFDLSPQGASSIAFPLNNEIKDYVSKYKNTRHDQPFRFPDDARKAAIDVGKNITVNDSVLSIARALSQKDQFFDQEAFFEQLLEDADVLGLNARQRLEIAEGSKDILPTWGDIKIFPALRRQ